MRKRTHAFLLLAIALAWKMVDRFASRRYWKNKFGDWMIKQLLNSVIAKKRYLPVSSRSKWTGHFWVSLGLCIKTRAQPLIWKWFFILMQNYSLSQERLCTWPHFESKGFWNSEVAHFLPQPSAWQITDLLATDRSRYFAQLRSIIVKYYHTC